MPNNEPDVARSIAVEARSAESSHPLLELRDVSFSYPTREAPTLLGVHLILEQGSFTAVVGRSGCGKTTLMNIIAGFLRPSTGTCRFREEDITGPAPTRIPVFQDDGLWPWWTVLQNVLLRSAIVQRASNCDSEAEARAFELLAQSGLGRDVATRFPKELSVGMRKRVELARALFAHPDLLIADEPFANVDPNTRESLHRLLRDLWKASGATFLIATHDLHDALYLASRILVMKPQPPSRIVTGVSNPFHGDYQAQRKNTIEYYRLYDQLRACMGNDND